MKPLPPSVKQLLAAKDAPARLKADLIAARSGEEVWKVWLQMDDLLSDLAASADERLSWQARHPV